MPSTLRDFRADPLAFLKRALADPSPTFDFKISGRSLTLLKDPGAIEELLVKRQNSFRKGPGLLRLRPVLGDGLLTSDGVSHSRDRRRLQPAFAGDRIARHAIDMGPIVVRSVDEWEDGSTIDLFSTMSALTLDVVSRTLLGAATPPNQRVVSEAISGHLVSLYRPLSRCPHDRKQSHTSQLQDAVDHVIDGHRKSAEPGNLVELILDSAESAEHKRDEIVTFLLGGHESVATALTWLWYMVAAHPDVRTRLEDESDTVSAGELCERPYARAVIAESLRLYPPAWMISREAAEPAVIGGRPYEKGDILIASPSVTHRDPQYWEHPEEFDPDRWLGEQKSRPRFSYFPFGGGARKCIGENFALTELTIVVAAISKRWRLDPAAEFPMPDADPIVTLRPAGATPMIVTRRKDSARAAVE